MKSIKLIVLAVVATSLAACTGQQYTTSAEYDDVYYTSADQAEPVAVAYEDEVDERDYSERRTVTREPVDSYRDHYYEDDDFTFSRRLRRFDTRANSNSNSWRYYDPYFSNDLYYVMGTPSWNTWNNNGWYSWNQPRFGSFYSPWNDPFNRNFGSWNRFNQWNGWNTWNSPYYNPWVNNYYGFGAGVGIGYANPFSPFGGAYFAGSAAYYCPPIGFTGGNAGWGLNRNNRNNSTATVSRPRAPRSAPAARTSTPSPRTAINNSRPTGTRTRVSNPNSPRTATTDYTRPRPASARPTRVGGTTVSPGRTGRPTTTTTRPGSTQPRVYTRPGRTSSPSRVNSGSTRPTRTTSPSRTSRPSRATTPRPSAPSRTGGTMSTPRRSGGSSFSRPSTTPSRTSSPRSSGGRSGGTVRKR